MQNAESNPTQPEQQQMAARSPAKTPAAGGSWPDPKTLADEFGSTDDAGSAQADPAGNSPAGSAPVRVGVPDAGGVADPFERAQQRIVSTEMAGAASTDDTVDADAKSLEARRDAPVWHDNVINSNATLENNVRAPATGLGGIDSREVRALPSIATRAGYRVVSRGAVVFERFNGSRTEHVFSLEPDA